MSTPIATGAALQYAINQLGGRIVETDRIFAVNTSVVQPVQVSGDRVFLFMMNLFSQDMYASITPTPSATFGVYLPANGGFISLDVRDDLTLVTREWYAICPGGGPGNLYIIEQRRFDLGD